MSFTPDTAPVRAGEEIPVDRLAAWLGTPVIVDQFPGGHSNLTYRIVTGDGAEYVLRRAPLGPVAPKAHDMAREFRVLQAVHPYFPPAPKPFRLCEDTGVIGALFYLMERRHGIVLRHQVPPGWAPKVSRAFLDCLVSLHQIDIAAHDLTRLGKPEGFVARQVKGWSERWYRARTEEMPRMDRVIEYLQQRLPHEQTPTLVHNDFKLDNLMLDEANPSRVEAVLDWEMATVGDPLVDLGLALCYWDPPDAEVRQGPVPCLTRGEGWLTHDQLVHEYALRTGARMDALPYHEVLGIFKLAVIVQQIYQRWHLGQTNDDRFRTFDRRVRSLCDAAFERIAAVP